MPKCNDSLSPKHPPCPSDSPTAGAVKKARSKGPIGRWLDKMANANEKEFGPKGPCCH